MTRKKLSFQEFLRAIQDRDFDALPVAPWGESIISVYSRKEAIADGVLIDVTREAKALGFALPVAITAAAWAQFVAVPHSKHEEHERLVAVLGIVQDGFDGSERSEHCFEMLAVSDNLQNAARVAFRATVTPGDDGRPVVTVMLAHED